MDDVLSTNATTAEQLVDDLRRGAAQIGRSGATVPGSETVFGVAADAIAAISPGSSRWREHCADILTALAAGTTLASSQTEAADRW